MSEVTFDLERKGYAARQVDAYVKMIQDNYQIIAKEVAEYEADMNLLNEQKEQADDKDIRITGEKLETDLQGQQNMLQNICQEQKDLKSKLKKRQEEADQLIKQIEALKEKEVDDTEALKKNRLIEEINQEKQTYKILAEEKADFEKQITELCKRIEHLDDKQSVDVKLSDQNGENPLNAIVNHARAQAEEYIQSVADECRRESEKELHAAGELLEKSKQEAEEIKSKASQSSLDDINEELEGLKKKQELIQKEKEEFLREYEYIKREAEVEGKCAAEEAENIIRRAQDKLEIAQEKEQVVTTKILDEIKMLSEGLISTYRELYQGLIGKIDEMDKIFETSENEGDQEHIAGEN